MSNDRPFAAVNHVGLVVRDLAAAGVLFEDVLGFERIVDRRGTIAFPGADTTRRLFGVDPGATAEFAFFRLGDAVVELLEWRGPGRSGAPAGNSDLAGRHLALTVSDMGAALARLSGVDGVEVREPNERGYVYVKTPLGLELQLIPRLVTTPPVSDRPAGVYRNPILRLFGWTRFLIVVGVAAALLLSAVLLVSCAATAGRIAWDVARAHDFTEKSTKELSIQTIELVDAILLATVVYIVALGLYELFVDPDLPVPAWLRVASLDDLKSKLVGVVIVLLGVTFLRFVTAWDGSSSVAYLGGGIALVIAALSLSGGVFAKHPKGGGE